MKRRLRGLGALVVSVAALAVASPSFAQRVGAGSTLTVTVGDSPGPAVTERLDGRRSNASRVRLPTRNLRILWTRQGRPSTHAPAVTRDGDVVVVGNQGDTLILNADGTDRARLALGPGPTSAPAILSDGTVIVVNGAGTVLGIRHGAIAFRSDVAAWGGPGGASESAPVVVSPPHVPRGHVGGSVRANALDRDSTSATRAFVLPLDDGGFALGFDRSFLLLDAEGAVRSRAPSSVTLGTPLLELAHSIAVVTDSGDVFTWDLTSTEDAVRGRGSFGGATLGAVAAPDGRHLLGVVDHARVVSFDVVTGATEVLASAPRGTFSTAFALGSGASSGTAFFEEMTFTGTRVVAIDPDGRATPFATNLSSRASVPSPDGGGALLLPPYRTRLFSDPTGALAYATVDGHVGVVTPTEKDELGSFPCGPPPEPTQVGASAAPMAPFAGLVPAGPDAFVVACVGGDVSYVQGTTE